MLFFLSHPPPAPQALTIRTTAWWSFCSSHSCWQSLFQMGLLENPFMGTSGPFYRSISQVQFVFCLSFCCKRDLSVDKRDLLSLAVSLVELFASCLCSGHRAIWEDGEWRPQMNLCFPSIAAHNKLASSHMKLPVPWAHLVRLTS